MDYQRTDCPCKKQRVTDSENGHAAEENSERCENITQNDDVISILPNLSNDKEEEEGISMCSGGLLDCLTEAYNLPSCSDGDTGEKTSKPKCLSVENNQGGQTFPSQRVSHDIAKVVQDTMGALAENTYIRNKEAELQSRNFDHPEYSMSYLEPKKHNSKPKNERLDFGTINPESKRSPFCGSESEPQASTSHSDQCETVNVNSSMQRKQEYLVNDENKSSRKGYLTDSGFINMFFNCGNPSFIHNSRVTYESGDESEALIQSGDRENNIKCETSDKCESYKMGNLREIDASGDSSLISGYSRLVQQSSSSSSEASPNHEQNIRSSILDNFFRYIPCSGANKQDFHCRASNTPFHLDDDYINDITNRNNINSLPPQMLVHIFRYLTLCTLLRKVSLVCKYWYNLSRDQDLWKNINLMNQHKLTDIHLQQLISFSDRVVNVNLTDCRFVTNTGVKILLARCKHLQVLKLMRCFDLTDEAFQEVLLKKMCSQLRCLRLDGCCRITDATITKIAKSCPHLQILHINQCTKITDSSIKVLADCCPRLTQLLMDHCAQVTEEGLEAIVRGCPNISYLNIMSCGVTDRGVKLLANLTNLSNVDLSNIPRLTPDAIVYLSRHCTNLECINICLNSSIDDNCVTELAKNLPKLKRLYCVSCNISDRGLEQIAAYRPTLEALDVGWCQDITDHGVRVISHACKNLDYFGLIRCDQVSVEAVEELVLQFPRVNYSTFVLESRRLLERARREGFLFGLQEAGSNHSSLRPSVN